MWLRNLLFVALCAIGSGAVAFGLLNRQGIERPQSFRPSGAGDDEFNKVVEAVDREFREDCQSRGLQFSAQAPALTIARRISLGLTGTVPSLEEIRAIPQSLDETQQVQWWLAHVLEDQRYADYVAERLARAYVGTENGPFIIYRRRRFVNWLAEQLRENVPYDQIVRSLLTDNGIWTSSPAVNFVSVTVDQANESGPDPIRLAGRTTRAFLGMRIDCLQCHDDRLGNTELGPPDNSRMGLQSDFHQLAAFFSEANISLLGIHDRQGEQYDYKYLDADAEQVVPPVPPFAPELLPAEGPRRERLAAWVTHPENKAFARAAVNRVWALLFGRPQVEPIDDIPLYAELPPGMETLADDFSRHGFDLQRLIRLIVATEVFQRDSRADFEITPSHEAFWAVFPLTRLRPEQVSGAIIQAASLKAVDANSHIVFRLINFGQQNEFIKRYGDTGEDEFEDRGGTVTQRLLMMNGNFVKERTKDEPLQNAATKIAILAPDNAAAVEAAYLTALTRRPSPAETAHFVAKLEATGRGKSRQQCLEDIFWVLFNSTEFSWNH